MDLGLRDKVVLLTGASGGIGATMARAFAAEGARVALTWHRDEARTAKLVDAVTESGGHAMSVRYDLTDPAMVRSTVEAVVAAWSRIDVLVASASPAGPPSRRRTAFEEVPARTWRTQLGEVTGAFHTVQEVLPAMKGGDGGRIVFLSASIVGRGRAGEEGYVSAKSALHGLSRTLATELVDDGILSNVVAPGPTVTDLLVGTQLPDEIAAMVRGATPEQAKLVLNREIPHLRYSTPEEVSNVVVFLASWANGNVTGSVVNVAGGL